MAENMCAMSIACEGLPADRGLMCAGHREEDRVIHERPFTDDVDPASREPEEGG